MKTIIIILTSLISTQAFAFNFGFTENEVRIAGSLFKNQDIIQNVNDPILKNIKTWMNLRNLKTTPNLIEARNFLKQNPTWPEHTNIIHKIERSFTDQIPLETLAWWFDEFPPSTNKGFKYYIKLGKATNEQIKHTWINASFIKEEEQDFLAKFRHILTAQDHDTKITDLLNNKKTEQAIRLLYLATPNNSNLFKARIAGKFIDNDAGSVQDAINYYIEKENEQKLLEIFTTSTLALPSPDLIWKKKLRLIRELIETKQYKQAYFIANHSKNIVKDNYIEAEWLAGWIAHSFLLDSKTAYRHFYNLYTRADFPISKSRGAYFACMAGKKIAIENAENWCKIASKYTESFYGQLANTELNNLQITKDAHPVVTKENIVNYHKNPLIRVAYLAIKNNDKHLATLFLKAAVEQVKTLPEASLIANFGNELGQLHISVKISKLLAQRGFYIEKNHHPVINIKQTNGLEKPLILAIIRQESMFDQNALSTAGAIGMMQIMPPTGSAIAKKLKLNFSTSKLRDPHYNTNIGSFYLNNLISSYDGSLILAIATYNAGPTNVKKWIQRFGDPRKLKSLQDIINWIELIPFPETRNYVERVLENLQIYRSLLNNEQLKISLDLGGNY